MAETEKKWDKERPFIRINSPSATSGRRLDGKGHAQGTRRQEDFQPQNSLLDVLVISQLIALTPSWAKTDNQADTLAERELNAEQEVFGQLKRSFQTWTDAPPLPWHTWYDWNFHVEPESEYAHLRGMGNEDQVKQVGPEDEAILNAPNTPIGGAGGIGNVERRAKREDAKREALVQGRTMELEWDCGAFGSVPGAMFGRDLAWPMTDWFVWVAGRSIYDGGHESEGEEAQSPEEIREQAQRVGRGGTRLPSKPKTDNANKTTRSELHPCKAVATARWEAHKFSGTDHFVPAIQFMFFSSKRGGYKDFSTLKPKGKDYEFIVDLPPPSGAFLPLEVPIGKTPDFPFNRVVLRQEPLVDFTFEPFLTLDGPPGMRNVSRRSPDLDPPLKLPTLEQMQQFAPRVELLPEKPGKPHERQAKVTIPITAFADAHPDLDSYGVIVSIGWFDPDKRQGKDVFKCTVKLKEFEKGVIDHDTFREEWRFKVGVNGRWFHHQFEGLSSNSVRALDHEVVLHLHKDDLISITSHGAEVDLVDDVYAKTDRSITISDRDINTVDLTDPSVGGSTQQRDIDWDRDVDGHRRPDGVARAGSSPVQRAICRKLFSLMFSTFNDQNDPLGIIDPNRGSKAENEFNPCKVSKLPLGQEQQFELKATATSEVGDSAELVRVHPDFVEKEEDIDYTLRYSILVETQDALRS